jgi:D-hydroxyproline dehydrogenase subunit alpha
MNGSFAEAARFFANKGCRFKRMSDQRRRFDVLVVGGGPAGIAAACCASESGAQVGLVDNNPRIGGQIWRNNSSEAPGEEGGAWFKRFSESNVEFLPNTEIFGQLSAGRALAESQDGVVELFFDRLILCTGARERFLPFPGWTLPNVTGAGGLQALVKSGLSISGKKVAVAGSGPLLLAVAAYLREHGADIRVIAEQAPRARMVRFISALAMIGQKLKQAIKLKRQLRGVPYRFGCWPISASGDGKLEIVRFQSKSQFWEEHCDYLACGFYLVPNLELPALLGCEIRTGFVRVDDAQQTSVPGIFCAGEPTAIGGLELSLIEGQIAGHAAVGNLEKARKLVSARRRLRRFALSLARAFELRSELALLPDQGTLVCRCEDVSFSRLRVHSSWRDAKLQTRCGMGPCQGRVCGPAVEFLMGWKVESMRPPIFPVSVKSLATTGQGVHT